MGLKARISVHPHVSPLSLRGAEENRAHSGVKRLAADAPLLGSAPCCSLVKCLAAAVPTCSSALLWGAVFYPNPTMDLRDCIVRSYDANSIVM